MTRWRHDPIEVQRRDGVPRQFLWLGRWYVVREQLAHWIEAGAWWASPPAAAMTSGAPAVVPASDEITGDLVLAPIPASPRWAQRAWGEPAPDVGAAVEPMALPDGERECWRVAAGSGSSAGVGVYDLCFDWASGAWSLDRVHD